MQARSGSTGEPVGRTAVRQNIRRREPWGIMMRSMFFYGDRVYGDHTASFTRGATCSDRTRLDKNITCFAEFAEVCEIVTDFVGQKFCEIRGILAKLAKFVK